MLEDLFELPLVREFLAIYPQKQWEKCVQATLLVGIRTIQERFKQPLTFRELCDFGSLSTNSSTRRRLRKADRPGLESAKPPSSTKPPAKRRERQPDASYLKMHQSQAVLKPSESLSSTKPKMRVADTRLKATPSNRLLQIAEDFLTNPLTVTLTQNSPLYTSTRLSFSQLQGNFHHEF